MFEGKTYLITGGASGIGLATAKRLRERGANLILWDTNGGLLAQVAAPLEATIAVVDVTLEEDVRLALNSVSTLHGAIHAAGVLRSGLFETIDLHTHARIVETNLIGTLMVAHRTLALLQATQGSLVLLSSISGVYGTPEYASYAASKAGVLNFAQALRIEQAKHRLHIGVVMPHSVDTPMLDEANRQARFVQRFGMVHTADEVAQAIVRGIERRRFLILPGLKPKGIYWLSRYMSFASHRLMSYFWR